MSEDIYAKFGDIAGESTDDKYKEWVNLTSISHGLQNDSSGDRSSGGGGAKGIASHYEIQFTKSFDAASVELLAACLEGTHFPKVEIAICRQSGTEKQEFLKYELTDAYLTNLNHSAAGGDVQESGAVNYGSVKWTYDHTDKAGKSIGKKETGWDRVANKKA
jgi:type VI secretion system secreted protein Hcp